MRCDLVCEGHLNIFQVEMNDRLFWEEEQPLCTLLCALGNGVGAGQSYF